MRIVLLGAPGSGKGTLGQQLERWLGYPRISTGDLLRKAVREGTPLGRQAAAVMARGELVSDEIVTGLVRERLAEKDCAAGYILDGYPRTIAQARSLAGLDGGRTEIVLALEVKDETVVARLSGRRVCGACAAVYNVAGKPPLREGVCDACGGALEHRPDDAEKVVRDRLRVYNVSTAPLLDHYRAHSDFRSVDGEGSAEAVFARARSVLAVSGPAAEGGR